MKRKAKNSMPRADESSRGAKSKRAELPVGKSRVKNSISQAGNKNRAATDAISVSQARPLSPAWAGIRLLKILWLIAVALTALSFGYAIVGASDLWWHLAIGRYVVTTRSLPRQDIWSFTSAGQPWLQHEWLSDVIFELWTRAFGLYGLAYWKWLVIAATFALLFGALYRATRNALASYLAVLCALIVSAPFLDIRPQLYTLLGCAFLLNLLWARDDGELSATGESETKKSFAPPVWLPFIFLVWVNLHGGFFFGLVLLFSLLAPTFLHGTNVARKRAVIIFIACALVCLINPNGTEVFFYPLKYALNGNSPYRVALSEWHSPFDDTSGGITSPLYPYLIGAFIIGALFLLFSRQPKKSQNRASQRNAQKTFGENRRDARLWTALALGALTLAMSVTSRRFITLFALAQSLTFALALQRAAALYLSAELKQRVPQIAMPILALAFALFRLAPYPQRPYAFHYLTAEDESPQGVCEFFERNQMQGNVLAYYSWGGFVTYCTGGRMKVYIDGRADTVYSGETLRRYSALQNFRDGWQQVIENSDAQYILFPRNTTGAPLAALVTSGKWRVLYEDYVSVLLTKNDAATRVLSAAAPTASPYQNLTDGVKAAEQQRYAEAENYFKEVLAQIPYERTACYALVDAQTARGANDAAQETLERCQKIFPDAQRRAAAEAKLNP